MSANINKIEFNTILKLTQLHLGSQMFAGGRIHQFWLQKWIGPIFASSLKECALDHENLFIDSNGNLGILT